MDGNRGARAGRGAAVRGLGRGGRLINEPRRARQTDDDKVFAILQQISQHKWTLGSFFEKFMASKDHRLLTRAGSFFKGGGMAAVFGAMLGHPKYALNRRFTAARAAELHNDFGPYFQQILVRMFRYELKAVGQDPMMHISPSDMSPQSCEDFHFQDYESMYLKNAPVLFGLIQTLCCVERAMPDLRKWHADAIDADAVAADAMAEELIPAELQQEEEEEEEDDDDDDQEGLETVRPRKKRTPIDKAFMSVVAFTIMNTARSQHNNGITARIGLFCRAMKVPKRMQAFLKSCGLCQAYNTTAAWMKQNATADKNALRTKVKDGEPFSFCWDNLVHMNKKQEETLGNQSQLIQNTSGYVRFMDMPVPTSMRQQRVQERIRETMLSAPGVGIPRSLLFKDHPDYHSLIVDPLDFLFVNTVQHHIPRIAAEIVVETLRTLCGNDVLSCYKMDDGSTVQANPRFSERDGYLEVKAKRSIYHTVPTMPIDETTLDGTAEICDSLLELLDLSPEAMRERLIFVYGDQLTYKVCIPSMWYEHRD
jgi:hypothetical protein